MATTETFVRPTTLLVPEEVTLSLFDQFNGRHYLPFFCVFKQPEPQLCEAIASELEQGLAKLLDEIPFLAGNVITQDDSRDLLTLEIPADGGVIFKVRRMIDPTEGPALDYDELERDDFPVDAFSPLVMCPTSFLPEAVAPCLLVQVNLIRGGLVLTPDFHHSIVDGEGAMTIIAQWAKYVAAFSQGRVLNGSDLLPAEVYDRTVLFPENPSRCKLSDFKSFVDGRELSNEASCWNVGERMEAPKDGEVVKGVSWYFTKENLQQIEEIAMPRNGHPKMTESSVLSAFIFKHFTIARRLDQKGINEASYHYPCNIRSRIEPRLHPQYLGNSVVPSRTLFPLSTIKSSSLYEIASAISSTIDWWTSDRVWELLGAMEVWPRIKEIERTMDLNCNTDLHLTNLAGFPAYDSYWGLNMGNMVALKFPALGLLDGYGLIMPRRADGGLEVILYMSAETLGVLKEDKEFTRYARFVCA